MKRLSNEEAGRMQKEGGKVGGWNDFVEHFMSVMVVMHTHTHVLFRCGCVSNLLGQMTGPIGRIEDLVVKDGKVESQPQSDRMSRLHLGACHFECFLI